MPHPPLWHDAAALAAQAHAHQRRNDQVTPYVAHPFRVAMIISSVFNVQDEAIIAAALLHDVIEDCNIDYDDVHAGFGAEVADLVAMLTKDTRVIEPERERRYEQQLCDGPWPGRLVKLADVYDNLSDADTVSSRKNFLTKARWAIDAAADDAPLAFARSKVQELIEAVEESLAGS